MVYQTAMEFWNGHINISVHEKTSNIGHWGQFLDLSYVYLKKIIIGFKGNVGHFYQNALHSKNVFVNTHLTLLFTTLYIYTLLTKSQTYWLISLQRIYTISVFLEISISAACVMLLISHDSSFLTPPGSSPMEGTFPPPTPSPKIKERLLQIMEIMHVTYSMNYENLNARMVDIVLSFLTA